MAGIQSLKALIPAISPASTSLWRLFYCSERSSGPL